MEKKLEDILLSTFEPIEDDRLDERFYELMDEETLREILTLEQLERR